MRTLARASESRTGSPISVGDRDALDTLMRGPATRTAASEAAGRLAVVVFRGGEESSMWAGVHMPLPRGDGQPQDADIVYERTGGSLTIARPDGTFLGSGFGAEFVRYADGEVRLAKDTISDCPACVQVGGREILSACLAADARRADDGRPIIAPDMPIVARMAAEAWPFEDPILQAAARAAILECPIR